MPILEKMNNLRNIFIFITALSGAFGVIYSGTNFIDSRYALASDVREVEKRLTLTELRELLRKALENLYFYRDQVRKYPQDKYLKIRLREAEDEVKYIKNQIRKLEERENG